MRLGEIKPQFILVMGGAGSGKNYYIKHDPVASSYKLIDVDAIKGEMGLDAAIGAIKPMLQAAFNDGDNVAHPTTGSNLKGQQNKIALARQYDYKVTIVLVDTPIDQAIAQVRKRYREGGHDVELAAIVNSNKKARENFEALKGLADDAIVVGRSSVNEDPIPAVQDPEQAEKYQKMFRTRHKDEPKTGKHEFIGGGVEAVVVRSPNDPSIIKIVGTNTNLKRCGTLQYLLHCKKHAYSNQYLPRVHSIQEFKDTKVKQTKMDGRDQYPTNGGRNFYVIKMEELLSLYEIDDNPKIIAALCAKAFPGSNLAGMEARNLADLIYWVAHDPVVLDTRHGIKVIDKQLQQAIKLIMMVWKQTGAQLDIHSDNVMVRVGPTGPHLVISDPLVNESNISW